MVSVMAVVVFGSAGASGGSVGGPALAAAAVEAPPGARQCGVIVPTERMCGYATRL